MRTTERTKGLVKFEHVDVLAFLKKVVEIHTHHYKEDFDLDKELIQKLALSGEPIYKWLFWMARPCGTHCVLERDTYLQGTYDNSVWEFYHEQNEPILAYAIHLEEVQDGHVIGTVWELNYPVHVERIKKLTCPISSVTVGFEDETVVTLPYRTYRKDICELMEEHGKQKGCCIYNPESEIELTHLIKRERMKRDRNAESVDEKMYFAQKKRGA